MKKESLVTANRIATDSEFAHLNITSARIKNLLAEGFINEYVLPNYHYPLYSPEEIKVYLELEHKIKTEYILLREFYECIGGEKSSLKPVLIEGLMKNSNQLNIDIVQFRGSYYVSRSDAEVFIETFALRSKITKELEISDNEYQDFKSTLGFKEATVTRRTIFVPYSTYLFMRKIKQEFISVEDMAHRLQVSAEKLFLLLKRYELEHFKLNRDRSYIHLNKEEYIKQTLESDLFFHDEFVLINQVYDNPNYSNLRKSTSTLKRLHELKRIELYTDVRGYTSVKLSTLEALVDQENYLSENFADFHEAAKLVNYCDSIQSHFINRLIEFAKVNQIEVVILDEPINKNIYFIHREQLNDFLKSHTLRLDILTKYSISGKTLNGILKNNRIPCSSIGNKLIYYPNYPLINILEEKCPPANPEDYYSKADIKTILNLNEVQYKKIKLEENLIQHLVRGFYRFKKSEIDMLKQKQDEYRAQYYSYEEVISKMPYFKLVALKEARVKSTALSRAVFGGNRQIHEYLYNKQIIDTFLLEDSVIEGKKRQLDNINYSDPVLAFERRLEICEVKAGENNELTAQCWLDYCYRKINATEGAQTNIVAVVSMLSKCTEQIFNATQKQELHTLSDNEINLRLFNYNIPLTHQRVIYSFIRDLEAKMKNLKKRMKFHIIRIINPFELIATPIDKSVYSFETYKELYEFANAISLHKRKAIEDVKLLLTGSKASYYSSSWLYVLVHLNNAWRHSDVVTNMPRLDLKGIPFIDLEWLSNNDLSVDQAKVIVNQLLRKEYIVSKTGATVRFSCSEELMQSVATAAIICELTTKQLRPYVNGIIDFGVKKQEFTGPSKRAFFQDFANHDFIFESRKLNRTLLSLTYMLLVKQGKTLAALEVAKRLRAHEDFETTNIYINISQEDMDELTQQLFHRQQFGYIPNLLAELLMGKAFDRQERTKQITLLNSRFQGIYGIERFSGFLNAVQAEKKLIADQILSMGYENAVELLFKLDMGLLPSKQSNIQCLVSETECIKPGFDCKNCLLSIPNFYALSSLVDNLEKLLQNLKKSFLSEELPSEKTRLMNRLYIQLDLLEEAYNTFGTEEVMRFFHKGEEGFFELLQVLDEINVDEDAERYLTYK